MSQSSSPTGSKASVTVLVYLRLLLGVLPAAFAGGAPGAESAKTSAASDDTASASVKEYSQPQRDRITIGRRTIAYTVTPGTLTIRNDGGEPIASMFYIAYTADRRPDEVRAVTFLFNGGPGTSSLWLLMGGPGPLRVDTPAVHTAPPAPYPIGPSDATVLDKTDLVYLDAIGTGLSRPLGEAKYADFFGVRQDIDAFANAILRYLDVYKRWNSPKFLLGESYGALRAAGLALKLQESAVQLNGIMLVSPILDYARHIPASDANYVMYVPSFAAAAWYHRRLAEPRPQLEQLLRDAREFARGAYLQALAKGDDLSREERDQVARRMAALTGLSTKYIVASNLRIGQAQFRQELLRDERRSLGRIDARFSGSVANSVGEEPDHDAAETALYPAYAAALKTYLFGTLGYPTTLTYRPDYYNGIGEGWDFTYSSSAAPHPLAQASTIMDLSAAMRQNPSLKVLAMCGYFDFATPFFAAEYDLSRLQLDPFLRENLKVTYYESGHMIYVEPVSRRQLKADLDAFLDSAMRVEKRGSNARE